MEERTRLMRVFLNEPDPVLGGFPFYDLQEITRGDKRVEIHAADDPARTCSLALFERRRTAHECTEFWEPVGSVMKFDSYEQMKPVAAKWLGKR